MLFSGLVLASLSALPYNAPPALAWQSVAPGVWRAQVGRKDRLTLLSAAEAVPNRKALAQLPSLNRPPLDLDRTSGENVEGHAVARLPLQPEEKLYGLGLQMHGSNRRGGVYHLRVDHYRTGQDRLHAPTPLYVSSRGYAVFFNTARPCALYAGVGNRLGSPGNPPPRDRNTDPKWDSRPVSDAVEASVQAPGLEVFLFAGPTPLEAVRRYNLFCGGGALPPRWALGFWHRVPLAATGEEVLRETAEFDRRGFPLDVLGLEPGWQSKSYPGSFEWSEQRFPDPAGFLKKMTGSGLHVNLWENPYVAESSRLYGPLQPYFASHTVWLGAVPDLNMPRAADILRAHHKQVGVDLGVSGYKIDEVDGFDFWLWPDHARFPSGVPGDQMRQVYGILWQREIDRLFHASGTRTFGLVRGSNGGASRFPFAIYSDTYDHREYITGMTSAGLAGVMWCAEARSASSGEEWVRRMQTAVLSHIAQLNAWSDGTKPWSFPGYEEPVKKAMLFRITLLPYLYTAFAQYHFQGTPVIRAMSLFDGGEETDQYLLGDDLLVAPMFAGAKTRQVRLPKGRWYDYDTGALSGNGETIEISPALDKIPLFVRDGALIPTVAPQLRAGRLAKDTGLIVRHYGTAAGRARLYDDDGETFGYEHNQLAWYELTSPEGTAGSMTRIEGAWHGTYGRITWQHIGEK
jgi:alpha-glucosidase (family GH31 glycosyl hydrolase)